jgi:hypothetical protein
MVQAGRLVGSVVVVMLAGMAVVRAGGRDEAREALSGQFDGRWVLDAERSDDGRAKLREAMKGRRGPLGGRRPPASGGGPMSNGPVGGGAPRGPAGTEFGGTPRAGGLEDVREAMDDSLHPSPSLTISHQGVAFEVVSEDGRVVRLYSDGRKNRGSGGGAIERKTRWEKDALVTEAKAAAGFGSSVRVVETWTLTSPDAGAPPAEPELRIATRIEGPMLDDPVVVTRVYTRAVAP